MVRHSFALVLASTALSFAVGCGGDNTTEKPTTTGTIPEQLESIEVGVTTEPAAALVGALKVSGSAREYTLSVTTSTGPVDVTLHSPGATPLMALDGQDVSVSVTEQGMGGRSLLVSDEAGILYAGVFGDPSGLTAAEEQLGNDFVRWGDEVGTETDGTFVWSYRKAVFATDDGDVTVLPGDVATIKLDGDTFRAVVIASYEVGTDPDATELPGCSPESMLGFELLRVAEAPAPEARVVRPVGAQVAYAGCTAPGGHGE